jgi:hypothetical protein
MATLADFFNAKNIVGLWEQVKGEFAKPLAKWFPYQNTNDVDITLAYGYEKQNVSLDLCAYDTNARVRGLMPSSSSKQEIPFFKNSVLFSEKDRREALRAIKLSGSDEAIANALGNHMKNVVDILLNGADVIGERYRAQLLQHGAIAVSSPKSHVSPSAVSINYDVRGLWRQNNVGVWTNRPSSGTSDILKDFVGIMSAYTKKNGTTPCTFIMNGSTYISICNDPKIDSMLQKLNYTKTVEEIISNRVRVPVSFLVHNGTYKPDIDEDELPYWEEDVISIVPNMTLGHVLCGLTPTQYDELYSEAKRDVKSSSENFCIQCVHRDDPVQTESIGSVCMLPQFDAMDKCFVIRP